MRIIYEPSGKAREYAELACNPYTGCPHRCKFCFGPTIPNPAKRGLSMEEWRERWHSASVLKANAHEKLRADCERIQSTHDRRPVLLSFACDPYAPDEPIVPGSIGGVPATRSALAIMAVREVKPIILTKGGMRAARDFDILHDTGGWFGQTFAWDVADETLRRKWEPNAAELASRIKALRDARRWQLKTWLSVEPVLDTGHAFAALRHPGAHVDHIKVGKLSGVTPETRAIERAIDWRAFLTLVREIMEGQGKREITAPGHFAVGTYYIKRELREAAGEL